MGGEGCISVLSNVLPKERFGCASCSSPAMCAALRRSQCRLLPVIDALFSEVNPIPVKAALAKMATAPTRCVCRSRRWRKDAGPSF